MSADRLGRLKDLQADRARLRNEQDAAEGHLVTSRAVLHQQLRLRGVDARRGFKLDASSVEALADADLALASYQGVVEALSMTNAAIRAVLNAEGAA